MESSKSPSLTLFRGFPETGCYTWSPFVTKLEARLRFSGLPYSVEQGSVRLAPRGKIPYVALAESHNPSGGSTPQIIGDSTLITKTLVRSGLVADLDAGLPPTEKLNDLALKALLEDKLYFYQSYEKWIQNFYTMRGKILAGLPWPMQVLVGHLIHRKNTRTLQGQGTLTLSDDEIATFRHEIWESINAAVVAARSRSSDGNGPFWIWAGETPTEADAVLFGFVTSGLICYAAPETQQIIRSFPAVVDYARRIHDRYFPDYVLWE
ncbi:hypothetical protein P170DRAFT_349274 [Aspergillus steynii IBT 23096]|uniref:Thioredoxin-like fold domain-containing protein n=1 Tax=Aspergillus steynii IBT 23096 TaxID=1392250 RepID=A0A2I2GL19_9EURO|nr:uncharacterized protein P170DRAFT_349274 [Aspergillus steynii IBT 23096]PLB53576.1 hypothetical protein P170DRAFT_349274 [Aspergillus steynii IBT 23096]